MSTFEALEEIGQPGKATDHRALRPAGRQPAAGQRWLSCSRPGSAPRATTRRHGREGRVAHLQRHRVLLRRRGRRLRRLGAGADRHDGAGAVGRADRPDRRLLLVRLPAHRRPPRGPQGRRHRRRRRRAGLLQPGQLLAVRAGAVRRADGPGAGVLLLVADHHRRRGAAGHHRRPALRVLRGAERRPADAQHHAPPEGPVRTCGRGPRSFRSRSAARRCARVGRNRAPNCCPVHTVPAPAPRGISR